MRFVRLCSDATFGGFSKIYYYECSLSTVQAIRASCGLWLESDNAHRCQRIRRCRRMMCTLSNKHYYSAHLRCTNYFRRLLFRGACISEKCSLFEFLAFQAHHFRKMVKVWRRWLVLERCIFGSIGFVTKYEKPAPRKRRRLKYSLQSGPDFFIIDLLLSYLKHVIWRERMDADCLCRNNLCRNYYQSTRSQR